MRTALESWSATRSVGGNDTGGHAPSYPLTLSCEGDEVQLRFMTATDQFAVLAFARGLPTHDLLFLRRDISQASVVAAWTKEIMEGSITSMLALCEGVVVGCLAVVRDEFSWSAHVGDIRIVVTPAMRGKGLGRLLAQEALALAGTMKLRKLTAQMTADQHGAISVFESLGFREEALLRNHVADRGGTTHDLAILSLYLAADSPSESSGPGRPGRA